MSDGASAPAGVRLAELVAVLSLGSDLGMGQPMEHAMRQCLIALRLGDVLGLESAQRESLYYVSLIGWVGCHVDAYEQAKWFGDDLALKGDSLLCDMSGFTPVAFMAAHLGAGRTPFERMRTAAQFLAGGRRDAQAMIANHWYAADTLAGQLGLDEDTRATLAQTFERWDGKGVPRGCRGDELLLAASIVHIADVLEVYHRMAGPEQALAVAREREGTQFAPRVVEAATAHVDTLFQGLEEVTAWDTVIAAEPGLARELSNAELDTALDAVADFIDIKSPFTLGHSRGVADLAAGAASMVGLGPAEESHVRRAGLLHDIGRLGVSNAVWDKPGELSAGERERVRLHAYLTDRMLAASPGLAALGATAAEHHERLDGTGYPRGVHAESLDQPGRLLAAADAYHAKLEPRPHRDAWAPAEAAGWLRDEVRAGRLDGDAVDGVLRAAGHPVRRRRAYPSGLTVREVEVLRLLARGMTTREMSAALFISPKTVSHHIESIYTKIDVTNRARASLFAVTHGLMSVDPTAPAADVFALLVDVDRMPEWNDHLHHVVEAPPGPLVEGAEWVLEMRAMGTRWPSRARALRVDPDGLAFEHRSVTDDGNPSYVLWSWQVTPRGDESALAVTWTVHPRTFWRRLLLARVRRGFLADEVRASLAGLDTYLQTTHAASRSSGKDS